MSEELDAFLKAHPQVRQIDAVLFDVAGRGIGKRLPVEQAGKLWTSGVRLSPANLVYDVRGQTQNVMGLGQSDGDPDTVAVAVPGSLAPTPWEGPHAAQVLARLAPERGGPDVWWDPRRLLAGVVARLAERGLTAVAACELEFYLVEVDGAGGLRPASPAKGPPPAGGCYRFDKLQAFGPSLGAIESACRAQAIPCGAVSAEYASTQFEINLEHRADAVAAADLAALQRRAVQGAARTCGMEATFMAKPFADQAGSGLHVHLSLVDAQGANVFDERRPDGDATLRAALGGLQAAMFDSVAVFAPNLNSYRRFRPGLFVPMNGSWGVENRSVALRVPGEGGKARRLEHRVAGADANPYLVVAVLLAGVLEGLERGLDPGEPATGDQGSEPDPAFPRTLWRALDRMAASEFAARTFGRFRDAYVELKTKEAEALLAEALPLEQAWYA